MNAKDRKRFQVALSKTKVSMPGPNLSAEELILRDQVFWEELSIYSIEAVEEAFQDARHGLKFFPVPAQIIEFIQENARQRYRPSEPEKRIEWAEPTEEGRKKARKLLRSLYDKWDTEDAEEARKKEERFQLRKKELLAQASLIK